MRFTTLQTIASAVVSAVLLAGLANVIVYSRTPRPALAAMKDQSWVAANKGDLERKPPSIMAPNTSCERPLRCVSDQIYASPRNVVMGHKETHAPQQGPFYSITSSAMAMSVGGIVSPRALAVFRLKANSNVVGASTGKSAGLAPRKILST